MSFWIEDSNQRGSCRGIAFAAEFGCDAGMDQFISKHVDAIEGTLSCFDRLIFSGYLPFFSGYAMAAFLEAKRVHRWDLKRFVIEQAERLKTHARRMAEAAGRPCEYLPGARDKDELARDSMRPRRDFAAGARP